IVSAAAGELDGLEVRLASPEAFARVGLDRPVGLTANLQMEVGRNAQGQPVIRITTPDRFNEPFLTFLLEADWGRGKVVREFSALADPPYIAPAVVKPLETPIVSVPSAPVAPPPEPAPATVQPVPDPEPVFTYRDIPPEPVTPAEPEPAAVETPLETPPAVAAAAPASEPEPEPVLPPAPAPAAEPGPAGPAPAPPGRATPPPPAPAPAPAPAPGELGPVAEGQTLWSIAQQVRPDPAVTMNQVMLAIQRANPEAFIDDNINLLK